MQKNIAYRVKNSTYKVIVHIKIVYITELKIVHTA